MAVEYSDRTEEASIGTPFGWEEVA
jgi:hypothetical protein